MFELAPQFLQKLTQTVRVKLSSGTAFSIPQRRPATPVRLLSPTDVSPEIAQSLDLIKQHLCSLQKEEGFWVGPVYDNVTMTAEYVMTLKFLGLLDSATAEKATKTMLDMQLQSGGWSIYGGGPADHSCTVEAYFALKLCGVSIRHKAMKAARELILAKGGIATARVFTKIHLCLFGAYPWSEIPVINPELMLLPRQAPIHLYEFSSWSRAVIVPLLIIFDKKPVHSLSKAEGISELWVDHPKKRTRDHITKLIRKRSVDLEQIFEVAQTVLSIYERIPMKPLRKRALNMAEKWIIEHQDPMGNWGGIFPAMANSLMALKLRGYSLEDPILQKGLKTLRSFAEENESSLRMQSTVSPVWDSAIASYALQEAGVSFADFSIRRCTEYLLKEQILDVAGDWRFKGKPCRPGGWPFEHENNQYPDIDDSALAILSLLPLEHDPKYAERVTHSIDRGIEWLLGMQGSDGGWGAFDRNNNRHLLNQIPFADLKSLLDPSTPDVTGHVIEALGAAGYERTSEPIERGVKFLKKTQEVDGSWFGRWGVAWVYGTGAVLSGLKIAGEDMNAPYVRKAAHWLTKVQNSDGGWGESCAAYEKGHYVPLGNSTASHTAWALLGLMASPASSERAIERGIQWLVDQQNTDGSWTEPEWTGTGFPRHFYLRYDYYRLYFPLMALGRYAARSQHPIHKPSVATA